MCICYCKNEAIIGGFSECIKEHDIDECSHQCIDLIEEPFDECDYNDNTCYNCKPKWNEPRRRCYEGISIDKKIIKTHKDEWEQKRYWMKVQYNFIGERLYKIIYGDSHDMSKL